MKVIIAGSRNCNDRLGLVKAILHSKYEITEVVSGTCRGVDQMGEAWAIAYDVPIKQFPADWNSNPRGAGVIRNAKMADYADAAILLWDGKSPGTLNMIKEMHSRDKPYFIRMVF